MSIANRTTDVNTGVDRVFQIELLRNAKVRAPYFIGTLPSTQPVRQGNFQAEWQRVDNMTPTTSARAEISTESYPFRAGENLTTTEVQATVAKYGQVLVLTEEIDLGNFSGHMPKFIEVLGISAGESLNRLQRNVVEDNATAIRELGAAADTDVVGTMTTILIRNAVNTLQRNSALKFTPMGRGDTAFGTTPIRPQYWGLTHVDVEEDIRDLNDFFGVEKYAGHVAVEPFEIGTAGGVRWLSSESASADTNSGGAAPGGVRTTGGVSIDIYHSIVFGMEAVGSLGFGQQHITDTYLAGDPMPSVQMIVHGRGTSGALDPMDEISTAAWKAWHAGAILNTAWVRRIVTGARILN